MKNAFTLIELLVVIAIIAILAAILFPVFGHVKFMAKQASGISNAKQLAMAHIMYAVDSDDHFALSLAGPEADLQNWPDGHSPQRTDSWVTLIQPYVKNYGIYVDPERGDPAGIFSGSPCVPSSPTDTACLDGPSYNNQNLFPYFGYNYDNLAPLAYTDQTDTDVEGAATETTSGGSHPADTVLLVQSQLMTSPTDFGVFLINDPALHLTNDTYVNVGDPSTFVALPPCTGTKTTGCLPTNTLLGSGNSGNSFPGDGFAIFTGLNIVCWTDAHASTLPASVLQSGYRNATEIFTY